MGWICNAVETRQGAEVRETARRCSVAATGAICVTVYAGYPRSVFLSHATLKNIEKHIVDAIVAENK